MTMSNTRWWALAALCCVGLLSARGARADGPQIDVQYTVKPADANNPKTKGDAPQIEATVIGAPNLTPDKFSIVDKSTKPPVEMKAVAKRTFLQGNETLAVAIVMLAWEQWIGNTTYRGEDDAPVKGVLQPLKEAMTSLKFKEAGPAGSVGMVITYSNTAKIVLPMGPLERLTADALGSEKDYQGGAQFELVKGIELALAELRKVSNPRKVLIIITDGNDSANATSVKSSLQQLKKQAGGDKVQVEAIIYKAQESGDNNYLLGVFATSTASSVDNIAVSLNGILQRMADRQYLTFPGFNKETKIGFKWDGKEHDLTLKIDKDEVHEAPGIVLAPTWSPTKPGGFPWLILILVIVLLLVIIIVAAKVFGKKEAPVVPMPMPMPMQAPAPAEAPKPLGPVKTVMIGQGGDEGGFPVVGWLVPLNGQNAYQTFRLRGGGTKIGTAPPADIVVNDGFMSTHHCDIHCSPTGFSLIDPGSTNGCYVNDKRVQKHDLVDNDVITLGKTNFKFKSIV